jgi:hypothetical protein
VIFRDEIIAYILKNDQSFKESTLKKHSLETLVIIKVQLEISLNRRKIVTENKFNHHNKNI